jgi:hypothetical protein
MSKNFKKNLVMEVQRSKMNNFLQEISEVNKDLHMSMIRLHCLLDSMSETIRTMTIKEGE